MTPGTYSNRSLVSNETLVGIARGSTVFARVLQVLGVGAGAFGAYLHYHFHTAMQEVERGAPNVAGAFIVARQAELSATGTALFFFGFCLFCISSAFSWLATIASAQSAGSSSAVSLAGAPHDPPEHTGA